MRYVFEIQGSLLAVLLHWYHGCVASILILHPLLLLGLLIDHILKAKGLPPILSLTILAGSQAFEGKRRLIFGVARLQGLSDFGLISHPIVVGPDGGFQFLHLFRVVRLLQIFKERFPRKSLAGLLFGLRWLFLLHLLLDLSHPQEVKGWGFGLSEDNLSNVVEPDLAVIVLEEIDTHGEDFLLEELLDEVANLHTHTLAVGLRVILFQQILNLF